MRDDLKKAVEVLRAGGVILYPTDTIWGLGCDASNEEAVRRIYEIKQREETKSLLVLIDSPAKLQAYVSEIPDRFSLEYGGEEERYGPRLSGKTNSSFWSRSPDAVTASNRPVLVYMPT